MSTVVAARRISLPESERISDLLDRMEPGDYCGPIHGYTGPKPAVFFLLPGSPDSGDGMPPAYGPGFGHVSSPPHSFEELQDGSLSIEGSILHTYLSPAGDFRWHGFLRAGHRWEILES